MNYLSYFLSILFIFFFISCGSQDPEEQAKNLSGYWEIQSVQLPDGNVKEFKISTTVDFIEVTGDQGVRTKVSPQLDGSFNTNKTAENFELKVENDSLRMYYTTPYHNWKETVVKAEEEQLILKNEDKIFTYKKFKKFDFE